MFETALYPTAVALPFAKAPTSLFLFTSQYLISLPTSTSSDDLLAPRIARCFARKLVLPHFALSIEICHADHEAMDVCWYDCAEKEETVENRVAGCPACEGADCKWWEDEIEDADNDLFG